MLRAMEILPDIWAQPCPNRKKITLHCGKGSLLTLGRKAGFPCAQTNQTGGEAGMKFLERVTREGITPETSRPDPAKVLSGDPVHSTWSVEEKDGVYSGLWQSTPGKWRVSYAEWEYVYIHHGHSILTDEAGNATHLRSGDSYIIRPGFAGTWDCVETTLKDYVIIE